MSLPLVNILSRFFSNLLKKYQIVFHIFLMNIYNFFVFKKTNTNFKAFKTEFVYKILYS